MYILVDDGFQHTRPICDEPRENLKVESNSDSIAVLTDNHPNFK
jgi:hypothetical protein